MHRSSEQGTALQADGIYVSPNPQALPAVTQILASSQNDFAELNKISLSLGIIA